jgi:hypothetical protein
MTRVFIGGATMFPGAVMFVVIVRRFSPPWNYVALAMAIVAFGLELLWQGWRKRQQARAVRRVWRR